METREYLRPGFLVVGEVKQRGCLSYRHSEYREENGGRSLHAEWKTDKYVADLDEQRALCNCRQRAMLALRSLGSPVGGLGIIVPLDREDDLRRTIAAVEESVREYNDAATCTGLSAHFTWFVIEPSDERIARALYEQAADVVDRLSDAIGRGDIKALRAGLRDLSGLDAVLPSDTALAVSETIRSARQRARTATRAAKKLNGEAATEEARRILQSVPVDGLRAALIEAAPTDAETIELDPVDARDVECAEVADSADVFEPLAITSGRAIE